jgi:hypothetical protein
MHSGTKIAAGIAVLTAILVAVGPWQRFAQEGLHPSDEGRALTRDVTAAPLTPGSPPSAQPVEAAAERVALATEEERAETAAPAAAATAQGDAPLTRIVACVLDVTGRALAGATLLAVRADGTPRGSALSPPADDSGTVVLELRDNELRAYKEEVFAMIFAVRASGHASAFSTVTPKRHGVTDLGTVVLAPGGAVIGTAVDPEGAPIQGAVVLAVESVAGDPQELRVTGPDLDIPRPRTTSDPSGRFRIDGVALHETRLWLHAPGRLWTIGRPVPVNAAGVTDVGQVVIEPAPPERRIAGQVLLPNGAPAGGAVVSHMARQSFDDIQVTADTDGRFVIVPTTRSEHELLARDPEGKWSPSALVTVPVGTSDLELVLRERRVIVITVTDTEGAPLEAAALAPLIDLSAQYFVGGGRFPPGEDWTRTDAAGHAELPIPAQEFCITASKSGYVGQRFGQYEPDAAPASLAIALEPEPAITGVVRCDGAPVAGVKIQIGQRLEGFVPREAGFSVRFFVNQDHGVRTDAEGRFVCPVDDEWQDVTVIAFSDTHATGELDLTLEPGRGARGVEVEVTHGGSIEGEVLPPAGRSAEGLVVAGSRGDGLPVWTRTDGKGRYRLERLAPGPWRIEGRAEPPTAEVHSFAQTPEEKDFGWSCDVTAGEITRHDVDMRGLGDVQLIGGFTIDGEPARGWTVALEAPWDVQLRTPLPAVELDVDGAFTLTAPAGRYELLVAGRLPGTESVEARYDVTLVGPRMDWSQGLRTGRLVESVERGTAKVRLFTGVVGTIVVPDAEGKVDVRVPVGESNLQHEIEGPYGLGWYTIRRIQVDG